MSKRTYADRLKECEIEKRYLMTLPLTSAEYEKKLREVARRLGI